MLALLALETGGGGCVWPEPAERARAWISVSDMPAGSAGTAKTECVGAIGSRTGAGNGANAVCNRGRGVTAAIEPKTYYSRAAAARILGVSASQLRAWQSQTRNVAAALYDSKLFCPARLGCAWSPSPQYHRDQIRLIDQCLHDPEKRSTYEETWAAMLGCLPEMTFAAAEDLGLAGQEV